MYPPRSLSMVQRSARSIFKHIANGEWICDRGSLGQQCGLLGTSNCVHGYIFLSHINISNAFPGIRVISQYHRKLCWAFRRKKQGNSANTRKMSAVSWILPIKKASRKVDYFQLTHKTGSLWSSWYFGSSLYGRIGKNRHSSI